MRHDATDGRLRTLPLFTSRPDVGKANVVLLPQDTIGVPDAKVEAVRDALAKAPGVTVVADIAPPRHQGERICSDEHHSLEDVILSGDAVVLGALEAMRAPGKDRADRSKLLRQPHKSEIAPK